MVRSGQACGSKLDWHRLGRSRFRGRIHQGRLRQTFQLRYHHGVLVDGDDGRPALRRIYGRQAGRLQSGATITGLGSLLFLMAKSPPPPPRVLCIMRYSS